MRTARTGVAQARVAEVTSRHMLPWPLLHWDLVDEGVSLHRDDDVGGLDWAIGGAVGAGDSQDQGTRLGLQRPSLGGQGRARADGLLGVSDLLADDGHP